jgi:hypothetical protein
MFVALVLYTSANGFENKIWAPARVVQTTEDGYKIRRFAAFPTLEEAQAALNEAIAEPFTSSIQTNGYRALIVNAETGETVSNITVAAVPQTESGSVQAN